MPKLYNFALFCQVARTKVYIFLFILIFFSRKVHIFIIDFTSPISFSFCSLSGKSKMDVMKKAIEDFNIKIDSQTPANTDIPAPTKTVVASLWAKYVPALNQNSSTIEEELSRFNLVNIANCEEDILQFWKRNENAFPKLSNIAKVLFAIPITSSKSESAFSTAGCLLRKDRAAITPYRIEKTLFVHDNYDLFKMR